MAAAVVNHFFLVLILHFSWYSRVAAVRFWRVTCDRGSHLWICPVGAEDYPFDLWTKALKSPHCVLDCLCLQKLIVILWITSRLCSVTFFPGWEVLYTAVGWFTVEERKVFANILSFKEKACFYCSHFNFRCKKHV